MEDEAEESVGGVEAMLVVNWAHPNWPRESVCLAQRWGRTFAEAAPMPAKIQLKVALKSPSRWLMIPRLRLYPLAIFACSCIRVDQKGA